MLILAVIALCAVTVPLAGGRLAALNDLRLRRSGLLLLALAIQIVIISIVPDRFAGMHAPAHLLSYVLAGAFFFANRSLPGLWLTGLGGGLNFVVIAANGGVMPAAAQAVAQSNAPTAAGDAFINSAPLAAPRLSFLGDVFSLPSSWPLSNVFSIGDVLIVVGIAVVLHSVGASRLSTPRRPRESRSAVG